MRLPLCVRVRGNCCMCALVDGGGSSTSSLCVYMCTREDVLSPHVRKSIYAYRYDSRKRADVTEGGGGESVYEYARAYVGRM